MGNSPVTNAQVHSIVSRVVSWRGLAFGFKTAALLTSSLAAVSVAAQDQPPASGGAAASQSEGLEIVVTAERRETEVLRTPISVSVVGGEELAERQTTTIQDLESLVPGLSYTQNGFTSNINLRGLGNTTTSPNITTGVAVFRDGLYQPEAIQLNTPFFDIASVEVLRGPQGTIVGQNSTGGALQINSRNPELDGGIGGFVEATVGNFAQRRLNGAVNLPISSILAARVAFNVERRDSFYTNISPNAQIGEDEPSSEPGKLDQENVRIGLIFEPSASFRALLKAEISHVDAGGLTARPRPACDECPPASSYYQYGYDGPSVYNGFQEPGTYDLVYNTRTRLDDYAERYSLELRYTFDGGIVLRSLSGYQHLKEVRIDDGDASAAPIGAFPSGTFTHHVIGPKNDYYSQEVNLISPDDGQFTWLLGASYFHRKTPVDLIAYPDGATPDPTGAEGNFVLKSASTQELIGVFGQVGYFITPSVQLQVGGRYSWDKNDQEGLLKIFIPFPPPGFQIPIPIAGSYSGEEPTGKISLNWDVNDTNFIYAFAARGYKQGGINSAVSFFQPEKVDDFEIGWKSKLFGNQALLQVGGYYMKYRDMQQLALNPNTTQTEVTNLGDSEIYGVEVSLQSRIGRLQLDGGFAYNHSELGEVSVVAAYQLPGPAAQLGPQCAPGQVGGCFDYGPYTEDLGGEANPYSPKFTANGTIGYEIPLGGDATLTPRFSVSHTSSQYAALFQSTDYFRIPARTTMDAYLVLEAGDWTVNGFVRNLTNKAYVTGLAGATAFYSAPRTFGVSVSRDF
jgi:iron complex outermembrane receptor protein